MELTDNRVAVLVEDHYADLELWYPALRLQEAGAEVVIVGPEARRYTSQYGLPIQADICAEQASADDFDAIIIPGGAVPDAIRRDPAMATLVHDMEQRGKMVARVQQAEATFAEPAGLREGSVITARPSVNLPAFCRMIIVALMAANSTPSEHLKDYG
jgi:protease I